MKHLRTKLLKMQTRTNTISSQRKIDVVEF